MSTQSHSIVMLRRDFKHIARNPTSVFNAVLMPVVMMLMFVYVFGDAFNVGVDYIDYATPGLMLLAVCYGLGATATAVNADMTKGIINRFKAMDVSHRAVLSGHVVASVLTNLIAIAALLGVAFLLGFSPEANVLDWLGVIGMVVLLGFAASWLTVALGLAAKSPETAGLATVPLIMLPFFSSAIVPHGQDGRGHQAVRAVPALHLDHRNDARVAQRRTGHRRRDHGDRVVRRYRPGRLPVGVVHLQEASVISTS